MNIMTSSEKNTITVSTLVKLPVARVWDLWTKAHHNLHWNSGSLKWQTTRALNDLTPGGNFLFHMEAKDGSAEFDFEGVYNSILLNKFIGYTIADGRKVSVSFASRGDDTEITETFEPEHIHTAEEQISGWQHTLESFKKYAENSDKIQLLHFDITLKGEPEKVYNLMLDPVKYEAWTSVFNPSSRYVGSWKKGSKIVFLGTDKNGKVGGSVARIRENVPNSFISIEHIGIVKNGEELLCGPEVDEWKGALENYSFAKLNDKTLLSVDVDSNNDFSSYFQETWPLALEKLRSVCE